MNEDRIHGGRKSGSSEYHRKHVFSGGMCHRKVIVRRAGNQERTCFMWLSSVALQNGSGVQLRPSQVAECRTYIRQHGPGTFCRGSIFQRKIRHGLYVVCGLFGQEVMHAGMIRRNWSSVAAVKHVAAIVEELLCLDLGGYSRPIPEKQQWQKPEAGWWKINTDASFSALSSTGAGGYGH
jgi:hypothetical protein